MQLSLFANIDFFCGQWLTIVVLVIFQLTLGDLIPLFHTHLDVYDKPS
jgi:hypothetical protein